MGLMLSRYRRYLPPLRRWRLVAARLGLSDLPSLANDTLPGRRVLLTRLNLTRAYLGDRPPGPG